MSKDATKAPEQNYILTASKDGILMLWSIDTLANHSEGEDMLRFNSELNVKQPITKAKWLTDNQILIATISGELLAVQIKIDSQKVPFLESPKVYYKTDSTIWDFVSFKIDENPVQLAIGQDSGRISFLCTQTQEIKILTVSANPMF